MTIQIWNNLGMDNDDQHAWEDTNVDHDFTLRIPKRAVAEGEMVHFEIAVTMYGPLNLPEGTKLISSILWLCLLEEAATWENVTKLFSHTISVMLINRYWFLTDLDSSPSMDPTVQLTDWWNWAQTLISHSIILNMWGELSTFYWIQ